MGPPLHFTTEQPPHQERSATAARSSVVAFRSRAGHDRATPIGETGGCGPRSKTGWHSTGLRGHRPARDRARVIRGIAPRRESDPRTVEPTISAVETIHRQRQVRPAHRQVRDRAAGPPGGRLGDRLPRRRDHAALGHHRRQAAQGPLRLLPAHHRRRGADVRRGPDPRLVLPQRGPARRGRDPHLPADRPPAAPDVQEGPAQRGPGRHHRPGARPRHALRRARDQRGVAVHPALRPAVLRPGRRRPGGPHRGRVGRVPDPQPARGRRLRHGRGRAASPTPATSRS